MKPIRVLHIIDSLATGGAERVAVNFVNALNATQEVEGWLCATRKEGILKDSIQDLNRYLFLQRKKTLDIPAIRRLVNLVRKEKILLIHAHSSSYFIAVMIHLLTGVKIIWHDHYGASEFLAERSTFILKIFSRFFIAVFCVNPKLEAWAKKQLHIETDKVFFIPNFADLPKLPDRSRESDSPIRILCLANLRPQKDHLTLLQAIVLLKKQHPITNFTVWLAGIDQKDNYSKQIWAFIEAHKLDNQVEILGTQADVAALLGKADIGVLSSESEGLPVALLEYGLAGLPVVCTSVGECPEVLGQGAYGILVPPKAPEQLAEALGKLINSPKEWLWYGKSFQAHIQQHYSKERVIRQLTDIYINLTKA